LKLTVSCFGVALKTALPVMGVIPSASSVQEANCVGVGARMAVLERRERILPVPDAE
jgi:hypothetical protein